MAMRLGGTAGVWAGNSWGTGIIAADSLGRCGGLAEVIALVGWLGPDGRTICVAWAGGVNGRGSRLGVLTLFGLFESGEAVWPLGIRHFGSRSAVVGVDAARCAGWKCVGLAGATACREGAARCGMFACRFAARRWFFAVGCAKAAGDCERMGAHSAAILARKGFSLPLSSAACQVATSAGDAARAARVFDESSHTSAHSMAAHSGAR